MGVQKFTRPVMSPGRSDSSPQALTSASTATAIRANGLTYITSTGGDKTFLLAKPKGGERKTIVCNLNSTGEVSLKPHSTAITFRGTTYGTCKFTTAGSTGVPKRVELWAYSSTSWVVIQNSTAVTFSA